MKGPQERLKYDLRRLWECPVCKRRERVAASQTFRFCNCQLKQADGKPVVMKLIQDGVQRLTPLVAIKHEPLTPVSVELGTVSESTAAATASESFNGQVDQDPETDMTRGVDLK
jgi:hypothetical protein